MQRIWWSEDLISVRNHLNCITCPSCEFGALTWWGDKEWIIWCWYLEYIYNYIYRMKDWLHVCLTINWWSNEHIYDVVKCHYITIRLSLLALLSSSFITITFYNCHSGWWHLRQQGCWLWWSPDFWQALTGVCWIFEAFPLPIAWIFLVFQSQNQFKGTSKLENHHF